VKENLKTLLWIVGLAALSVGARNFEEGMSIDAPLYATIARNLARLASEGDWFLLLGNVPDFVPFTEHPHGGFWLQALIFKLLPAADWSTRIQGHLFYVLSLFLIYKVAARWVNVQAATLSVFLLWTWSVYSNFFSTFYLDPGSIFFGFYFLYLLARSLGFDGHDRLQVSQTRRALWAVLAGLSLALSFLFKGLTALGFGLPAAALLLGRLWKAYTHLKLVPAVKRCALSVLLCLGTFALVATLYYVGIKNSSVPDFLDRYWQRQISNRFGKSWTWGGIFNSLFWIRLLKDSHYLLLLMPVAFWRLPKNSFWMWTFLSWLSFVCLYAPAQRIGSQYWILIFPPMSLALAGLFQSWKHFSHHRFQRFTLAFAVSLVVLIQYLPFPTHHPRNPIESSALKSLQKILGHSELIIAGSEEVRSFIYASTFAWYADTLVHYLPLEGLQSGDLAQTKIYRAQLSQTWNPSKSVLFQHTRWPGQKEFPCQHQARWQDQELKWELYRDFGGTAIYAPAGRAPEQPTRCIHSKI
jgi:4-amino-4-deoxy-L-arabinose transferase-like glycosyltransferase